MSKAAWYLGGAAVLATVGYFIYKNKTSAASAAASAQAQKASTPRVQDQNAWTPPAGYPQLPAGWTLPAGMVPPAGWVPPLNWAPPTWLSQLGWQPGQPIPGIPLPPPPAIPGVPTVPAVTPGPRGDNQPVQRAYKLGLDDGAPTGWSIPGIPSTLQNLPDIPGLTGRSTSTTDREMAYGDKVALWRTLFANKIKWSDYCFDPASGCMQAHGVVGDSYVAGQKGALIAQDIAYLNDGSTPRDATYENPNWTVLYSPSTGVFWMLPSEKASDASKTDDYTIFLRGNEYHAVQMDAGQGFIIPDDQGYPATATGESTTKQAV